MNLNFKKKNNFQKRLEESKNIIQKYPDRIPIIVEKSDHCIFNNIDKSKYLVPKDMTIGQFIYIIRKRIHLESNQALFCFINNILPPTNNLISNIYNELKDDDGFLYIIYSSENTFG